MWVRARARVHALACLEVSERAWKFPNSCLEVSELLLAHAWVERTWSVWRGGDNQVTISKGDNQVTIS